MVKQTLDIVLNPLATLGRYSRLLFHAFGAVAELSIYRKNLWEQMVKSGVDSIPIVCMAAGFSGAVSTVQTAYQLVTPLIPRSTIGAIVVPSMILELGAVVTGFILAGRVGARIAAELGTMRVTEQIDALESMGLNSIGYLIVPRVLAGIIMFPVLYVAACFVGIGSGMLIGDLGGFVPAEEFLVGAREFFHGHAIMWIFSETRNNSSCGCGISSSILIERSTEFSVRRRTHFLRVMLAERLG